MSKTIRSLAVPVTAIVLFQVCALFARSYYQLQLLADGVPKLTAKDVSYLLVPLILLVLSYPILRDHRRYLRSLFNLHDFSIRTVIRGVLTGTLIYFAFSYSYLAIHALQQQLGQPIFLHEEQSWLRHCNPATSLAFGLGIGALLTPLIEEVFHRGLILPGLLRFGTVKAVIIGAVLFAIFHRPEGLVTAFVFGLYAGVQFLRAGHLLLPTVTHGSYNFIVIANAHCDIAFRAPANLVTTSTELFLLALAVVVLASIGAYKLLPDKPEPAS